jgi:membrane peptidoglycan carboxypeptidase
MIQAMKGVVKRGTAMSVRDLPGHFAGKTGTTNDYTDAWFVGFNPAFVCGVWAGRDDHLTLGNRETGGRVALPIWRRFMEPATQGQEGLDFPMPDGITKVLIDPRTGLRAGMDSPCTEIVEEVFIEGTEPTRFCDGAAHFRLRLPYFLQAYPVERDLSVVIPEDDLEILLRTRADSLFWTGIGRQLSVTWEGTTFPLKVRVAPPRDTAVPQAVMPDLPPEGTFKCGARVEYVNEKR